MNLKIDTISYNITICKAASADNINIEREFFFLAKTDEEISLVCKTEDVPENTTERSDGWKGFRIRGVLDFSLVGILSHISAILAENRIGIFACSTYNTDYIFVKKEDFDRALSALDAAGYSINE